MKKVLFLSLSLMMMLTIPAFAFDGGLLEGKTNTNMMSVLEPQNINDNDENTRALLSPNGFIEWELNENYNINKMYFFMDGDDSTHVQVYFYNDENLVESFTAISDGYTEINVEEVNKIKILNDSVALNRRINEFDVYGEPTAPEPLTHNYDLTGVTNRPTDQQINDFINQYEYLLPVNSGGSLYIVGSDNPISVNWNDTQKRLYFSGSETYMLLSSGTIVPTTGGSYIGIVGDIITTDIGQPNTVGFYFTYPADDPVDTTPPAPPAGLTATPGDGEVQLEWDANTETDLAGYYVYQDGVRITSSLITATTYTVSDLINGTSYEFYITAVDTSDNESLPSGSVTATPEESTDIIPPAAPEGLTATAGDSEVVLTWNANSEDDLAGYYVYQNGVRITSSLITATTYTVSDLINGTSYEFYVTAVDTNDNESLPSGSVTTTPEALPDLTPPAAPEGLTATPLPGRIYLKWQANSEDDLAGYYVYQNDERVNDDPTTKTEMTVTDVVYGEDYTFFVTAVDKSGNESDPSESVTASPQEDGSITMPEIGLSSLDVINTALSFINNVLPEWVKLGLGLILAVVLYEFLLWIMAKIRRETYYSGVGSLVKGAKLAAMSKEERKQHYIRGYREERRAERELEKIKATKEERQADSRVREQRGMRPGRQGRA